MNSSIVRSIKVTFLFSFSFNQRKLRKDSEHIDEFLWLLFGRIWALILLVIIILMMISVWFWFSSRYNEIFLFNWHIEYLLRWTVVINRIFSVRFVWEWVFLPNDIRWERIVRLFFLIIQSKENRRLNFARRYSNEKCRGNSRRSSCPSAAITTNRFRLRKRKLKARSIVFDRWSSAIKSGNDSRLLVFRLKNLWQDSLLLLMLF